MERTHLIMSEFNNDDGDEIVVSDFCRCVGRRRCERFSAIVGMAASDWPTSGGVGAGLRWAALLSSFEGGGA